MATDHWSFELCPTSSTADDRQRDLDFHSFDDHRVCLWVMALFSTAMCFSTFQTGLRLGEAEEFDRDTRNIALEGVAAFRDSQNLHSSETLVPQSSSQGKSISHSPSIQPIISLPTSQSLSGFSVQNRSHRSQRARSRRVESTKRSSEKWPHLPS